MMSVVVLFISSAICNQMHNQSSLYNVFKKWKGYSEGTEGTEAIYVKYTSPSCLMGVRIM